MIMRHAGFRVRAYAYIIDVLFLSGIYVLLLSGAFNIASIISDDSLFLIKIEDTITLSVTMVFVLLYFSYFGYNFWASGDTIGKRYYGLKVVTKDGKKPSLKRAIARSLSYWLSSLFGIGFLWIAVDRNNQGFHDKIARTYVVKKR